jgi:tRNA G37 N-methylase Trm5
MIQLTKLYHKIIEEKKDINIAVDMTCGHGYDTLFLAKNAKKVYGFDIQLSAIEETQFRLKSFDHVQIIHDDHQHIQSHIHEKIDVAIFNLGYMPGGDFSIATKSDSTLVALKKLIPLMAKKGLIILELYPHNPAEIETIISYSESLSSKIDVVKLDLINKKESPSLLVIQINE